MGSLTRILLFASLGALAACSKQLDLPAEVKAALDRAGDQPATFPLLVASGSMAGIWTAVPRRFASATALIEGQKDTPAALLQPFSGAPAIDDDLRLAIHAYALARRGESSAQKTLQEFLAQNVTGELVIAPHFVTRAVHELAGKPDPTGGSFYYLTSEMRGAVSGSFANRSSGAALTQRASCERRYVMVDANGVELRIGGKRAVVAGREFASDQLPEAIAAMAQSKVKDGEGRYVEGSAATEDAGFVGRPSKKFDCGGYAFRHFNGGRPWKSSPDQWYAVLVGAGAIEPVSIKNDNDQAIAPGDIVFYRMTESNGVGHVARVRATKGVVIGGKCEPAAPMFPGDPCDLITVRNADQHSGLWEAPIDAKYFFGKAQDGSTPYYVRREVWRWKNGVPPRFIPDPDPSWAKSPDNCANDPAALPDAGSATTSCALIPDQIVTFCEGPPSGSAWNAGALLLGELARRPPRSGRLTRRCGRPATMRARPQLCGRNAGALHAPADEPQRSSRACTSSLSRRWGGRSLRKVR